MLPFMGPRNTPHNVETVRYAAQHEGGGIVLFLVYDSTLLIYNTTQLDANQRNKVGLTYSRDKNEGSCHGGEGGEEPA